MSNDKHQYNLTVISAMLGIHRDTIRKRIGEAGVSPVGKKGNAPLYSLADVSQAVFAQVVGSSNAADPDKLPPKEMLDYYKGSNEKLKYLENVGELVKTDNTREVQAILLKRIAAWFDDCITKMDRSGLFTADQLIQLEKVTDEMRVSLHNEITMEFDE
ncbi:hypothetical protein [Aeromonas phage 59.1]|nr:hypothetical protein [Aeromonas phage 59.1]